MTTTRITVDVPDELLAAVREEARFHRESTDRAVDERYAAELDAARPVRCVAHAGRCIIHDRPVDTGRPFDGCGL